MEISTVVTRQVSGLGLRHAFLSAPALGCAIRAAVMRAHTGHAERRRESGSCGGLRTANCGGSLPLHNWRQAGFQELTPALL
jgi:hypothetical protein